MDKTIKSLETSTLYDDQSLQAERFKLILDDLLSLMKTWTNKAGLQQSEIIKDLDSFYNDKKEFNEAELLSSGFFEVNAVTMDQPGLFPRGWNRGFFYRCQTLGDFFTLLHQNLIVSLGALSKQAGQSLQSNYPPLLKQLDNQLDILGNFVFSKLDHPKITLHYNVPLRDHSGRIILEYDYVNHKATLKYMMFGENENQRWTITELYSYIKLASMQDITLIQPPYFNRNKRAVSFEIEINDEKQINPIMQLLKEAKEISMITSSSRWSLGKEEMQALEITEVSKLKPMLDYFNNVVNKVLKDNWISQKFLKPYLIFIEYFSSKKNENFDINIFLSQYPKIITDNTIKPLYAWIVKDKDVCNQIQWDFREDELSFSLLELKIQSANLDLISAFKTEAINPENSDFLIFSILKTINDNLFFYDYEKEKVSKCSELIMKLIKEKGITFKIRSIEDWKQLSDLVNKSDYRPQLLQILHTCDLETKNLILNLERTSTKAKHSEFVEALAM